MPGAELLVARVPEVGLVEERVDGLFARLLVGDAFEDGEVVEDLLCCDVRVDPELLRQVAEGFFLTSSFCLRTSRSPRLIVSVSGCWSVATCA
jgi:hypothetical protein